MQQKVTWMGKKQNKIGKKIWGKKGAKKVRKGGGVTRISKMQQNLSRKLVRKMPRLSRKDEK